MPSDVPSQSPASTVKADFALPVGGAALNVSVQLPAGRTTLTQLLPIIQNLENAVVAKISAEASAAGHPISCRAGCGACCRQLVPINLFEAEALADWLATLPEERMAVLRERFSRALALLRNAGVIERILDGSWSHDEQTSTELAVDYFHAGAACPFLENESCSIHPMRPLICREYLVTSPPHLCQDPAVNNVSGIQLPLRLSRAMFAIGQEIEQDHRGTMPLVFLLAWARNRARPGDLVAGSGPEVLKRFLNQVFAVSVSDSPSTPREESA
jgi:Fe-S-cluster containining protein